MGERGGSVAVEAGGARDASAVLRCIGSEEAAALLGATVVSEALHYARWVMRLVSNYEGRGQNGDSLVGG